MTSIVQERILAFESMERRQNDEVKGTSLSGNSVGNLISFFENHSKENETESRSSHHVEIPAYESRIETANSWDTGFFVTARSRLEDNEESTTEVSPLYNPAAYEKEERPPVDAVRYTSSANDEVVRNTQYPFIFHINAPATNVSQARANAQRRQSGRVSRGQYLVRKGLRILREREERRKISLTNARSCSTQDVMSASQDMNTVNSGASEDRKISSLVANAPTISTSRSESDKAQIAYHRAEVKRTSQDMSTVNSSATEDFITSTRNENDKAQIAPHRADVRERTRLSSLFSKLKTSCSSRKNEARIVRTERVSQSNADRNALLVLRRKCGSPIPYARKVSQNGTGSASTGSCVMTIGLRITLRISD